MPVRTRQVGNLLIAGGAILGIVTVVAIGLDYAPTLSPEMVKLMFHKGMAAGAVGLIIVGSWIARAGRNHKQESPADSTVTPHGDTRHELTEGSQGLHVRNSEPRATRVDVTE